jgi:hypothetical protein
MKTQEGWVRGKLCGKPHRGDEFSPSRFICAVCLRYGLAQADLCYPVKVTVK